MKEIILKQDEPVASNIDYANELNAEQLAVVKQGDGPCLVLAGAGSGKTRTITYRVAYLLEQGISPKNILLLTFTNKAAKEMLSRVEMLLSFYPNGLWGGTFHSIANRLLRIYATEIGFTPNFTILDQSDAETLTKICVKDLEIDTTARRFPSAAKLHGMISYARNSRRSIADIIEQKYNHFFDLISVIERVAEVYETRKQTADAMDFDDLLLRLHALLQTRPDIQHRLASQFEYVLVDEYQDTNVLQAEIITALSNVHKNILVVGDDAQSIYSFRAAEIKNILSFPDQFPNVKTFRLTKNYRSTPDILCVANETIQNNRHQFQKELSAMMDSHEKPQIVPAANANQEAKFIAQQILTLQNQNVPLKEIAVLFRAAFHSQVLEFELMRRDIPYDYRGGLKFFERAHIKDVISFLRIKANIKDEVAWMRILGLQTGIGLVSAQKIFQQLQGVHDLYEIIATPIKCGSKAIQGWNILKSTLQKLSTQSQPSELIRAVVSGDYRNYLEAEYPDFIDRLEDLEQFALFSEQTKDLTSFLEEVSLTAEYGSIHEEEKTYNGDRVILSTIHQAKGLEWDAVFVMHLADGKFPNPRALLEEDSGLEEERRLFYVATTRARKYLYFTYPIMSGNDTLLFGQPSVFLQELDPNLLEEVRLKNEIPKLSTVWETAHWDNPSDNDPIIVWDDSGEVTKKINKSPGSFLRDV